MHEPITKTRAHTHTHSWYPPAFDLFYLRLPCATVLSTGASGRKRESHSLSLRLAQNWLIMYALEKSLRCDRGNKKKGHRERVEVYEEFY